MATIARGTRAELIRSGENFPMHALRRLGVFAFLAAFLFAHSAHSQVSAAPANGLVTGSVTDSSGAVIPGASVNLRSTAGYNRTTPADADGNFHFGQLPYGSYTLTVT